MQHPRPTSNSVITEKVTVSFNHHKPYQYSKMYDPSEIVYPLIQTKIHGHSINIMIDTGAASSHIMAECVEKWHGKYIKRDMGLQVIGFGKNRSKKSWRELEPPLVRTKICNNSLDIRSFAKRSRPFGGSFRKHYSKRLLRKSNKKYHNENSNFYHVSGIVRGHNFHRSENAKKRLLQTSTKYFISASWIQIGPYK